MSAFDQFAAPQCTIEIYPFEGGSFTLTGGQIKSLTVSKSLAGASVGQFSVELANGGPNGPEDPVTWSQVITPMSHVLIGMSRGNNATIVMDGVVNFSTESQVWSTNPEGSQAARGQYVTGSDFAWFYQRFNYYALTFLGMTAGIPGIGDGTLPGGLAQVLSQGLVGGSSAINGSPVQVGQTWYEKVMAGADGILAKTFVPFVNKTRYTFSQTMATQYETYPSVYIPYGDYFMTGEENWADKFLKIFPHPWYEFFVTTATSGTYTVASGSVSTPGHQFSMKTMPTALPAGPKMVARVNPTPFFDIENKSSPTIGSINVSRWNQLPLFDFTKSEYGYLRSAVNFSSESARNFYQLNPTYMRGLAPQNNTNNIPVPFLYFAATDPASVHRYGFAPQMGTIRWMYDPTGSVAQNSALDVTQTILTLTGKMISWFHPAPLMANAQVTLPLTPQIQIGTKFRYAPFKDGVPWDFYIDSFRHQYVFGGQSSTTLTLSRGLPVYAYENLTLLQAIHTGNAQRLDGFYVEGLPEGTGPALQLINTQEQAQAINGQLATVFVTPQPPGF